MLRASVEQIGEAARMRHTCHGKDRKTLNYIVHSPDSVQQYGSNPFANHSTHDPNATAALKDIALRHHMPVDRIEFAEMMHTLREFMRSTKPVEGHRVEVAEQVLVILEKWWRVAA
jgi:hypothetical protein